MALLDSFNELQTTLAAQEKVRADLDSNAHTFGTAPDDAPSPSSGNTDGSASRDGFATAPDTLDTADVNMTDAIQSHDIAASSKPADTKSSANRTVGGVLSTAPEAELETHTSANGSDIAL